MRHDGLTWLGRHPWVALPIAILALPLYAFLGAVDAVRSDWWWEVRYIWKRYIKHPLRVRGKAE
jgi:hypothetical protein